MRFRMQLAAALAAVGALLAGIPGTASAAPTTSSAPDTYQVVLRTACELFAGTDADVYIKINGTLGSTPERELENPGNDREVCNLDRYTLSGLPDVGSIQSVDLRFRRAGYGPGWKLQYITVSKVGVLGTTRQNFYNKWIEASRTYRINLG